MSQPIIDIQHIHKKYRLNGHSKPYESIRESVASLFSADKNTDQEEFYALKDLSFQVQRGESIGIIGNNGAGKSTLLKILSRITYPTSGQILLRGKVASLLEVGTGFHPELSGRENIFLNGSILGLSRIEIKRHFDEIVAFSGVAKFIDTALKHYSSGMQLRLAFSVAAHLEPEILIIDEVLAVGDSAFQQKCVKKMTEVSQSGRTILFVSHNLHTIRSLCSRCILLDKGQLISEGDTDMVVNEYTSKYSDVLQEYDLAQFQDRKGKGDLQFDSIKFAQATFQSNQAIEFALSLIERQSQQFDELDLGIAIKNVEDLSIVHMSNKFLEKEMDYSGQHFKIRLENPLKPGDYKVVLFLKSGETIQDWITEGIWIRIVPGPESRYSQNSKGLILPTYSIEEFIG